MALIQTIARSLENLSENGIGDFSPAAEILVNVNV
jgi:hypothetical protein